ncbi:hypothetical protein N8590_02055 [bacterium]|nr:hypothetical protein [bacterium]
MNHVKASAANAFQRHIYILLLLTQFSLCVDEADKQPAIHNSVSLNPPKSLRGERIGAGSLYKQDHQSIGKDQC